MSSVAKRDPVGRKPKRRVFAAEGLVALQKEAKVEVEGMLIVVGSRRWQSNVSCFTVPPWASLSDVREFEGRLSRIKADLLCELIGVKFSCFPNPKTSLNHIFYTGLYLSKRI